MMKTNLFIFLLISTLWVCPSCREEDDKLPGTKPEMLIGKWESFQKRGSFIPWYILETYEFTSKGGSIKQLEYFPEEDRYEDYFTQYFMDWSYDGRSLHFIYKKGGYRDPWSYDVSELTPDYFILDTGGAGDIYSKVK